MPFRKGFDIRPISIRCLSAYDAETDTSTAMKPPYGSGFEKLPVIPKPAYPYGRCPSTCDRTFTDSVSSHMQSTAIRKVFQPRPLPDVRAFMLNQSNTYGYTSSSSMKDDSTIFPYYFTFSVQRK